MEHSHEAKSPNGMKSRANIALIAFLLIGAYFLITEDVQRRSCAA